MSWLETCERRVALTRSAVEAAGSIVRLVERHFILDEPDLVAAARNTLGHRLEMHDDAKRALALAEESNRRRSGEPHEQREGEG